MLADFSGRMLREGERLYRDLPWRYIDDPFQVLVSEIMLQQTQVKRVIDYWSRFISLFPSADALASAETALVLENWQGLGYNRRALMLKRAAEICSSEYGGEVPREYDRLLALPGVGPATAAGVRAFAHNLPGVYLETNVRTVFIHEFFPEQEDVKDKDIIPLVEETCPKDNPRQWYYALLDYGAFLKQTQVNPSRKSAHHTKQSTFEGSRRQKRAEILRCVLAQPGITKSELFECLVAFEQRAGRGVPDASLFDSIVSDMLKENFFSAKDDSFFA